MAISMDTPLTRVLGPKTAGSMADQLGLHTVGDLLRHYPRRYASRGEQADLADVQVGDRVTVLAQVRSVTTRPMRNRRGSLTEVVVGDGSGRMKLVFFNHRHAQLKPNAWGMFAGTVGEWRGEKQFAHPDMHLLEGTDDEDDWARALVPIYPASKDVSSWVIQKSVKLLLADPHALEGALDDPIPEAVRRRHGLVTLATALLHKHRPETTDQVDVADERLKWDEALVLQVTLAARRRAAALEPGIARPRRSGGLLDAVDARLPFSLTDGQREVGDLAEHLCGVVGAGVVDDVDAVGPALERRQPGEAAGEQVGTGVGDDHHRDALALRSSRRAPGARLETAHRRNLWWPVKSLRSAADSPWALRPSRAGRGLVKR